MSIKVGLFKMDERRASRLRIVFKMVFKGQCVVSEIEKADTVIINIEKESPETVLAELYQSHPNKPAIFLSGEPINLYNMPCLIRPFKSSELLKALKQTSSKSTKLSANSKEENTADSILNKTTKVKPNKKPTKNSKPSIHQSSDIYYQPDSFLQGKVTAVIEKANKKNISVFLRCWSHRWIVVSPKSGHLVENLKEKQIANLGIITADSDVIFKEECFSEEQMLAMAETPIKEVKVTSIQKFIWNIAVRTSRGRIPEGTSVDELFVLKQWPNLTRLAKVNNSMRISAFWLDQPQSISDIINQLEIPPQDVFTYFSAACATGLISKAKRREDKMLKPDITKVDHQKKGLFSAILRKLSRFTSSSATKDVQEK